VEESVINGVVPDATLSSAVTILQQQAFQWQAALGILHSKFGGLDEANVITCSAALDACEACGGFASVLPLLSNIECRGTQLLSGDPGGKDNVGHAVVALEMLAHHGCLRGAPTAQFQRRILVPVARRLRQVEGLGATLGSRAEHRGDSSQHYFWQLQDEVLERQFGLGRVFAAEALQNLDFARPRDSAGLVSWRMKGHLAARRAMFAMWASKKNGPEFTRRVAWLCFTAAPQAVRCPAESSTTCGSLGFTAGWDAMPFEELQQQERGSLPEVLPVVLMGTKPSQHAERQALLLALHGSVTFAEMQTPTKVASKSGVVVKQGAKRKVTIRLQWPWNIDKFFPSLLRKIIKSYSSATVLSIQRHTTKGCLDIRLKGSNAAIAKAKVLILSLCREKQRYSIEEMQNVKRSRSYQAPGTLQLHAISNKPVRSSAHSACRDRALNLMPHE